MLLDLSRTMSLHSVKPLVEAGEANVPSMGLGFDRSFINKIAKYHQLVHSVLRGLRAISCFEPLQRGGREETKRPLVWSRINYGTSMGMLCRVPNATHRGRIRRIGKLSLGE